MSSDTQVYCLQFVSQGMTYFLPSAAVLEILPFNVLRTIDNQPTWLHGMFDWRDVQIPIINLNLEAVQTFEKTKLTRVIIFYSLISDLCMPYVGAVISQIPKSMVIEPGVFIFTDEPMEQDYIYRIKRTAIDTPLEATIVDLENLSKKILAELPIPVKQLKHG